MMCYFFHQDIIEAIWDESDDRGKNTHKHIRYRVSSPEVLSCNAFSSTDHAGSAADISIKAMSEDMSNAVEYSVWSTPLKI